MRSQHPTKQQRAIWARLRRMFGALSVRHLRVKLEDAKARLRVRTLQLHRMRDAIKRRALNQKFRSRGVKVLGETATLRMV